MNRIAVVQFIYCCPQNFSTQYKKLMKEFKKAKCTILELDECILRNYFGRFENRFVSDKPFRCSKCREIRDFDGVRVTIKYEIPR